MSEREGNLFGLMMIAVAIAVLIVGWVLFQQRILPGVESGLIVGLIIGSLFWPIVRTPDLGGRALIGGFVGVLLVLLLEALRLGNVFQDANIFTLGGASLLGGTFYAILLRVLQVAYLGAAVAILLVSPANLLIGAMIGAFVAAAVGGVGVPILAIQGVVLQPVLLWVAIGLVTLGVLVIFASA